MNNDSIPFKLAVSYLVSGYTCREGNIEEAITLLREVADDYDEEIQKANEA